MANTKSSNKMNEKKKVPQRGLGVAQLERIRLEGQHKKDSIFQTVQCPKFIPTSSRIDFTSKDCVFRPNQSAPFLENCPKLWSGKYSQGVDQKVDQHGIVFGHNSNLPSETHSLIIPLLQRSQQYQQTSSSSSMVNISSGISSSSVQNFQMEPPSNQSYYGCNCLPLCPEEIKMTGVKRPYPFSQKYPPVPKFRCKIPQCCVASVSRSHESASSSDECSVNVEEGNARKREIISKSKALSESEPSISVGETKALNGDFLRLAPPAAALPHLQAVNRRSAPQSLQLFDYVPSRVAAAEPTLSSGLSISVQQPILRFSPSAKVQIGREGTRGSDSHTEARGNVDLELKL